MSYVYGWGLNDFGQLGFEIGEFDYYKKPVYLNTFFNGAPIIDIACGENHSIAVLQDGTVYSFGSNEFGQLGRPGIESHALLVQSLGQNVVSSTSCGRCYSLVLTDNGKVFSWGQNNEGQLGRITEANFDQSPAVIKTLSFFVIVQIACGHNHSLALSNTRKIYSWGSNLYGQLANCKEKYLSLPSVIADFSFIPVSFISCGGTHSFALSVSGAVFGWGNNKRGQLGFSPVAVQPTPSMLNISNNHHVVYVTCGDEHSAFLTEDGGIFIFGGGKYGCLGHGDTYDQFVPMRSQFLMGMKVTQVVCGSFFTFAFVPQELRLYCWGFNGFGQLALEDFKNRNMPNISSISAAITHNNSFQIFAGFNHVFGIFNKGYKDTFDQRLLSRTFSFISLSCSDLYSILANNDNYFQSSSYIEDAFSSVSCINASFLSKDPLWGQPSCGPNVDLSLVEIFMNLLAELPRNFQEMVYSLVMGWLDSFSSFWCPNGCFEGLRFVLILFYLPCFGHPQYPDFRNMFAILLKWFTIFHASQNYIIVLWYSALNPKCTLIALMITKAFLVEQFKVDHKKSQNSFFMLNFLSILYKSNLLASNNSARESINPREFYIENLSSYINIKDDYFSLYFKIIKEFYLFNYPFIYTMEDKVIILNFHDDIEKQIAVSQHVLTNFANQGPHITITNPASIFFTIRVSREYLLEDTIDAFRDATPSNMRRPLYVVFAGEDAMDYGGVRKEFFMLLFHDLLDQNYALFEENPESRLIWFCPETKEKNSMFNLAGILCGLCIYNNIIVNLPFPPSLYKKILGRRLYFPDLAILNPSLGRGLKSLLDYEGPDFEDIFMLSFQITVGAGNSVKLVDLIENGDQLSVTNDNKANYVDLYVDYFLNKSIETQFGKFEKGFRMVVEFDILKHFDPLELESLIVGRQSYNFEEWEKHASYDGEFHSHHPVIVMFWRVFHSLGLEQKKSFLLFLTGSDRIPFSGLRSVPIKIQPSHVNEDHLPVAHTCFNVLDLPLYSSDEVMRKKLLASIEHTKGFGLI